MAELGVWLPWGTKRSRGAPGERPRREREVKNQPGGVAGEASASPAAQGRGC